MDFILNLPNLVTPKQVESYYTFFVNCDPYKWMTVDVTTIDNKPAIILQKNKEFTKVYYPSNIKVSHKNYDTDGKYMVTILCDDFWVYHEKIPGTNSDITNFGRDMDMPFLSQQDFKDL